MIVVADDDHHRRSMTMVSLIGHRRDIQLFDRGDDALAAIHASTRLRLLVCSTTLPGLDGVSLTREVRAHPLHGESPVIVTCPERNADLERVCAEAGADCCLPAPIDLTRLRYEAELLMSRRGQGTPG